MGSELTIKDAMPLSELESRAEFLSKSSLIPTSLRGKKADIAVILQMGSELGVPPMQALNGINVIQGKPVVSSQMILALIFKKIPCAVVIYRENTAQKCIVEMARSRDRLEESFKATWDMERAKRMGLSERDNWKKQPETMLKWRAVAEAARAVFPDVLQGFYVEGEIEDKTSSQEKAKHIENFLNEETIEAELVDTKQDLVTPPGDHVIDFGNIHNGKKVSDLSEEENREYIAKMLAALQKMDRPLEQKHQAYINAVEIHFSKGEVI